MIGKPFFKYKYTKLIFFALIFLFCLRVINLDQDLAPWGIAQYQPVDEGAYSYLAINEKTYGSINPKITYDEQIIELAVRENFISNIPGNYLSILCFHIFGNNYFGLRVPYVICGIAVFLLFFLLIDKLRNLFGKGSKKELFAEIALLIWYVTDFTFFNATRIAEPTMVRLVFVLISVLIYISFPENHTTRFFVLGILATFSTFLVYITNVFLFFAIGLSIVLGIKEEGLKTALRELGWFILGSLCMFVIVEGYYWFIWRTEAIINTLRTVKSFSSNSSAELTINSKSHILLALVLVWAKIVGSNSFIYNLPVLFAFSVSLKKICLIAKKDKQILFLLLTVLCFVAQTFLSYDTVTRKIIIIFPLIIALLYVLYVAKESDKALENENTDNCHLCKEKTSKIIDCLLLVFGTINVIISVLYRVMFYDGSYADYDFATITVLIVLEIIPLIAYVMIAVYTKACMDESENIKTDKMIRVGYAVFVCMCVCNLVLTYKYFWKEPSFKERDNMIELSEFVDDKYVLGGGFQLGYSLYNDMKPILNTPENTIKLAGIIDDALVIEYTSAEGELEEYFHETYYSEGDGNVYFIPEKEIERSFQTFGYTHNMCLYRIGDAHDYSMYRKEMDTKVRTRRLGLIKNDLNNRMALETDTEESRDVFNRCIYPYIKGNQYPVKGKEVANIIGSIHHDISVPIYGDVYGDIHGDIEQPIHGTIYGDIYGDVNAEIDSDVYGLIYGKDNGNVAGKILGKSIFDKIIEEEKNISIDNKFIIITNDVKENVDKNIYGNIDYNIYGDINGYIFGDINGDVYGNVAGAVFGKINGAIHGNRTGILKGGSFILADMNK